MRVLLALCPGVSNLLGPNLPGPDLPGPNLPGPHLAHQHFPGAQFATAPKSVGPNLPPNRRGAQFAATGANLLGPNLQGPQLPHQGPDLPQHQKVWGPICRQIGEVPNLPGTDRHINYNHNHFITQGQILVSFIFSPSYDNYAYTSSFKRTHLLVMDHKYIQVLTSL